MVVVEAVELISGLPSVVLVTIAAIAGTGARIAVVEHEVTFFACAFCVCVSA